MAIFLTVRVRVRVTSRTGQQQFEVRKKGGCGGVQATFSTKENWIKQQFEVRKEEKRATFSTSRIRQQQFAFWCEDDFSVML